MQLKSTRAQLKSKEVELIECHKALRDVEYSLDMQKGTTRIVQRVKKDLRKQVGQLGEELAKEKEKTRTQLQEIKMLGKELDKAKRKSRNSRLLKMRM